MIENSTIRGVLVMHLGDRDAFPVPMFMDQKLIDCTPGLTKREYFAAMALQGVIAGFDPISQKRDLLYDVAAKEAVAYADQLLEELNK